VRTSSPNAGIQIPAIQTWRRPGDGDRMWWRVCGTWPLATSWRLTSGFGSYLNSSSSMHTPTSRLVLELISGIRAPDRMRTALLFAEEVWTCEVGSGGVEVEVFNTAERSYHPLSNSTITTFPRQRHASTPIVRHGPQCQAPNTAA